MEKAFDGEDGEMKNLIDSKMRGALELKKRSKALLRSLDAQMRKIKASMEEMKARQCQASQAIARGIDIEDAKETLRAIDSGTRETEAQLTECKARIQESVAECEQAVADLLEFVDWYTSQTGCAGPRRAGHGRNPA